METPKFVIDTVMAVATHLAQRGIEITIEKAKEIVQDISNRNPGVRGQIDVDEMAKTIQASAETIGRVAYNEETLARFLEVPVPDLATITPGSLDTQLLYDHVRLESEFRIWLEEWGYEVELGCELAGLGGLEHKPDVYGKLNTLHGEFEICINFVCDDPPSEDRVFALLGKIEAYAEAKRTFSFGDVFLIITPRRFGKGAVNAIGLQNEQESYCVVPLEGGDIYVLENARTERDRLNELQDKVRQAEEEARRNRSKRAGREREEMLD